MVLILVFLVRGGRLSEVTPLQAACKSFLYVYTAHWRDCPALLHVFMCDSSSKSQPEAEHREQHTLCFKRDQETSTPSHQGFLSKQWYHHGPEELGDRRVILFPPRKSLEILNGPELLTHIIISLALMRLYFWKMGAQDIDSFYILTAAFVNFHFLLVNHTERVLSHKLQVTVRIFSSRINTSFPHSYCPEMHPQWNLCQNAA